MKQPLLIFLTIVLSLGGMAGCTSSDLPDQDGSAVIESGPYSDNGFVLKSNVRYFSGNDLKYISVLDTNKVSVSADLPEKQKIAIGDVVLVDFSETSPLGFAGRVVSEEGSGVKTIFKTQTVSLEDIYEELTVDTSIDVMQNATSLIDSEGNNYEASAVDEDYLNQLSGDRQVQSKAELGISEVKRIPLHTSIFDGGLIVSFSAKVNITIKKGKIQDYKISIERKNYIAGELELKKGATKEFTILPELELRFPTGIPICPGMVLQPILSTSLKAKLSGSVKLKSDIYICFEDTKISFHNGTYTNNSLENIDFKMTPFYLDCEGSVEFIPRVALKLDVWGLKLLGFGVDGRGSMEFTLNAKTEMSDKELMSKTVNGEDVKATIKKSSSIGVFLYGKLLNSNEIRGSINIPSTSFEVNLLDKGKNYQIQKEVGKWSVAGEFNDDTFMSVDDRGLALFMIGEEEPVYVVSMTATPPSSKRTKNGISNVVSISGNPFKYYLRPYNLIRLEGVNYFFYGNPVGNFIKSMNVLYGQDYSTTLKFEYDEFGRLVSAGSYKYKYGDNDVSISGSLFGFPYGDTGGMQTSWHLFFDNGKIKSGTWTSTDAGVVSISSGYSMLTLDDDNSHYFQCTYGDGIISHMKEHGISHFDENHNPIYFTHDYDFSYGSQINPASVVDLVYYSLAEVGNPFPPFIVLGDITNHLLPTGYSFNDNHNDVEQYTLTYSLDSKSRIDAFNGRNISATVEYLDDYQSEQ